MVSRPAGKLGSPPHVLLQCLQRLSVEAHELLKQLLSLGFAKAGDDEHRHRTLEFLPRMIIDRQAAC
jgi:hypothetical protein